MQDKLIRIDLTPVKQASWDETIMLHQTGTTHRWDDETAVVDRKKQLELEKQRKVIDALKGITYIIELMVEKSTE